MLNSPSHLTFHLKHRTFKVKVVSVQRNFDWRLVSETLLIGATFLKTSAGEPSVSSSFGTFWAQKRPAASGPLAFQVGVERVFAQIHKVSRMFQKFFAFLGSFCALALTRVNKKRLSWSFCLGWNMMKHIFVTQPTTCHVVCQWCQNMSVLQPWRISGTSSLDSPSTGWLRATWLAFREGPLPLVKRQ